MDALVYVFSWGSPIGIALFLFILAGAGAIFMWGLSQLTNSDGVAKGE